MIWGAFLSSPILLPCKLEERERYNLSIEQLGWGGKWGVMERFNPRVHGGKRTMGDERSGLSSFIIGQSLFVILGSFGELRHNKGFPLALYSYGVSRNII
eukprot:sb/3478700/